MTQKTLNGILTGIMLAGVVSCNSNNIEEEKWMPIERHYVSQQDDSHIMCVGNPYAGEIFYRDKNGDGLYESSGKASNKKNYDGSGGNVLIIDEIKITPMTREGIRGEYEKNQFLERVLRTR